MSAHNPYQTLGVSKSASQDDIKAAYRKLAKKLHPDLNPGKKSIEEKFKEVNKAYELIGTEEAKAKFDRGETDEARPHYGGFEENQSPFQYYRRGSGPQNFDSEMFGDFFSQFGRKTSGRRAPEDEHYSMEVDFKTSILGGEREITLPSGKRLKVKIPGGINSGQKLRLSHQSSQGGDAFIEVTVRPDSIFRRVEQNIEMDLPLGFQEAILGAKVRVATVDGYVLVTVPSGVTTGSKIRIKGKGVSKGSERGDQFAVVTIVMPPKIDDELKEAVKKWNETNPFNPRT